jgi:hypothetical protein
MLLESQCAFNLKGMPSGGHNKIELTAEIRERIIDDLMNGKSIQAIAASLKVSRSTIDRWRSVDKAFADEVLRAVHIGFDARCDRLEEIALTERDVQRAKLRCDNEKWALARQAPHKYGDKLSVDVNQTVDIGPVLAEARAKLRLSCDLDNAIEVESTTITQDNDNKTTGSEPDELPDDGSDLLS